MSSRRPIAVLAVLALVSLALSGCIATLAPIRPLISSGSDDAETVAVAVQPDATRHVAWSECTAAQCRLQYRRTLFGAPSMSFTFAPGDAPDVDATDDGTAFVVWRAVSGSSAEDRFAAIPASQQGLPIPAPIAAGQTSIGAPIVVARGDVAYAVYETPAALRYRQLAPLDASAGVVVPTASGERNTSASAAIDSAGKLHIAYHHENADGTRVIGYGSNASGSGDMTIAAASPIVSTALSAPDIAIDVDDVPSIVYSYDSAGSDVVEIATIGGSTVTVPFISLLNPWRLDGNPHITTLLRRPTIVFGATNNATPRPDIWMYTPVDPGVTDPGPQRVTNDEFADGEPLIVTENSTAGDVMVVAWRRFVEDQQNATRCYGDGFMFYENTWSLQRVFSTTGGCDNAAQDLAASGPWVTGAWIDRQAGDVARLVPWLATNAITQAMPIVPK